MRDYAFGQEPAPNPQTQPPSNTGAIIGSSMGSLIGTLLGQGNPIVSAGGGFVGRQFGGMFDDDPNDPALAAVRARQNRGF